MPDATLNYQKNHAPPRLLWWTSLLLKLWGSLILVLALTCLSTIPYHAYHGGPSGKGVNVITDSGPLGIVILLLTMAGCGFLPVIIGITLIVFGARIVRGSIVCAALASVLCVLQSILGFIFAFVLIVAIVQTPSGSTVDLIVPLIFLVIDLVAIIIGLAIPTCIYLGLRTPKPTGT